MSTLENERSGKGVTMGIPTEVPKEDQEKKEGVEGEESGEPSLLASDNNEPTIAELETETETSSTSTSRSRRK